MKLLNSIFLFLAFSAVPVQLIAQFSLLYKVQINYSFITSDNNANIYVVSGERLFKYSPEHNIPLYYDLSKHGIPDLVDVCNSRSTILYFHEIRKIILLDTLLNEKDKPFFLDQIGLFDISLTTGASDNGLWFYNQQYNSVLKISDKYALAIKPIELRKYILPGASPTCMVDFNNSLYINIPPSGIFVFNGKDGRLITIHDIQGIYDFQVVNDQILYFRDGCLFSYNQNTQKTYEINLPVTDNTLNANLYEKCLILYGNDEFSVYRKSE